MKYKCLKCGNEFEALHDVKCPNCGAWSSSDVISLFKYQHSQTNQPKEVPA